MAGDEICQFDDTKAVLHHFGIVCIMIRLISISRRTLNSRSSVTGTEHVYSYPRNSIECEVGDLILIDSSMNHHVSSNSVRY